MMEDDDTELAWPTRPLRDFETSLRCGICGDFYVMPVSFRACSHAFCSDCARRALPVMEKCPQCREPGRESDLVPNKALELAVQCFKAVRAELLDAIVVNTTTTNTTTTQKKKKKRAAPVDVVTLLEEEEEEEIEEVARGGSSSSSSSSRDNDQQQQQQQQQNQSAPCPVCNVSVSVKLMNAHLNTCLVKSEQLSSPTTKKKKLQNQSAPSSTTLRLPKLAYHVFTLTKLREMCKSAGLNATGDKKQLETRHREFTARVNGVVDYGRIPDRAAIAREVNREEARKIGAGAKARIFNIAAAAAGAATTNTTTSTSDATFARLIEEVRSRQQQGTIKKKIPAAAAVKPPPSETMIIDDEFEGGFHDDNDDDDDWCDEEVLPLSQAAPRYVPSSDDE
jgi:E3 ubiquitin-protein ligase RAD18